VEQRAEKEQNFKQKKADFQEEVMMGFRKSGEEGAIILLWVAVFHR
jgi:hypothetical protein